MGSSLAWAPVLNLILISTPVLNFDINQITSGSVRWRVFPIPLVSRKDFYSVSLGAWLWIEHSPFLLSWSLGKASSQAWPSHLGLWRGCLRLNGGQRLLRSCLLDQCTCGDDFSRSHPGTYLTIKHYVRTVENPLIAPVLASQPRSFLSFLHSGRIQSALPYRKKFPSLSWQYFS